MNHFHTLIIGAGQAGIPLARFVALRGERVGLIERTHLGGSCVNFGCTPTKAVLASARVARLARRAHEYGVRIPTVEVDFPAVMQRARKMVSESKSGLADGLHESGAIVINGHARFAGRDGERLRINIGEQMLTADHVVIDVGTRTAISKITGLDRVQFLDAGNWLARDTCPKELAILGASYIGLEMAQFYRAMGATVCVIGPDAQILEKEDGDVAAELQKELEAEGITFRLNTCITSIDQDASGQLTLKGDGGDPITATDLFLATGRRPNTDDLGLDAIGVSLDDRGYIHVDDRLATNVPGVYAAGDVRGGPMFTHAAWDDHRVIENQLFGDATRTIAGRIIPYAVFTCPEVGRVGLSEAEAKAKYGDVVRVARFDLEHNGKAVQSGDSKGFIKVIAGPDDRLVGATILGSDAAELIASYITLMNSGATLAAICHGIYIHPTMAEALQSAVGALDLNLKPSDR